MEPPNGKLDAGWIKKSRIARDSFGIATDFMPLEIKKATLRGVPRRNRMLELLNISEAVRLEQGPFKQASASCTNCCLCLCTATLGFYLTLRVFVLYVVWVSLIRFLFLLPRARLCLFLFYI
jgi:hypothetical protein